MAETDEQEAILVVDDSFIMRTIIKDIVDSDPELEGRGLCRERQGRAAEDARVEARRDHARSRNAGDVRHRHDEAAGAAAKAKVIVVSSVGQIGSPQAVQARQLGAVDIIAKPSGAMSLDLQAKKGHEIVQSLRRALGLDPTVVGHRAADPPDAAR